MMFFCLFGSVTDSKRGGQSGFSIVMKENSTWIFWSLHILYFSYTLYDLLIDSIVKRFLSLTKLASNSTA